MSSEYGCFSWAEIDDQTWSLITRRILPHPLIGNITVHQSCITRLEAGENCAVIDKLIGVFPVQIDIEQFMIQTENFLDG